MVDIQSATAEIRRRIKKERRYKSQGKNIMSASAMQGGRKKQDKNIMSACATQRGRNEIYLPEQRYC